MLIISASMPLGRPAAAERHATCRTRSSRTRSWRKASTPSSRCSTPKVAHYPVASPLICALIWLNSGYMQNASLGRRHRISRLFAIHHVSNSYSISRNIAVAFSANCRRDATWGERMAFPWELNLDRPQRDEKWPFPEQRVRGESTDPVLGGSAEKLEGIRPGTAEGFDRERVAASASRAADGERPQIAPEAPSYIHGPRMCASHSNFRHRR
jgi:hypothetical protein